MTSVGALPYVIAIDGPAGSGKSTAAKLLAKRLGDEKYLGGSWFYLDSGAMYRAVTAQALGANRSSVDPVLVARIAQEAQIEIDPQSGTVRIDGRDVTEEIRSKRVDEIVSDVAKHREVREVMVVHQRHFAEVQTRIVADGRDMGTVVFPNALVKVFLIATLPERARRRYEQMRAKGDTVTLEQVREGIRARDLADEGREVAPAVQAPDAQAVGTDGYTPAEVCEQLLALVKSRVPPVAAR